MEIETISTALNTAIEENSLDQALFRDFDTLLTTDPKLARDAQALLPLFTKLATHTDLVDELPPTLIPKILQDASLEHIFSLVPPQLFAAGLDQPSTAPMLVQMLQRADPTNKEALELCKTAIDQILDPFCTWASIIEQLVEALAAKGCCPQIPDQRLYESTDSQLQCRLMALNLILVRLRQTPRFLFWDLTSPDLKNDSLLMSAHVMYLCDLCTLGVDISQQMPVLCALYMNDTPFVCHDIERTFLALLQVQPIKFRELDSKYGLVAKQSVSLLARLPAEYLLHHAALKELTLNSRTLPVYCNLVSCYETYEVLELESRSINQLPFDLRAQLIAAATTNARVAHHFVARFPAIMDAIVAPAAHPESAQMQQIINANLRAHGIRVVLAPEIQASSLS